MSGHTPGPWRLEIIRSEADEARTKQAAWGFIHRPHHNVLETSLADARLIAAAPELLNALQEIRAYVETSYATPDAMDDPIWQWANGAIAKAEGTPEPVTK